MKFVLATLFVFVSFAGFSQQVSTELIDSLSKQNIYIEVDDTAYPALGMIDFYKEVMTYCSANYPVEAKQEGIIGNVFVAFIVELDGSIGEVTIQKGLHKDLDETCIDAVKNYKGKWIPGRFKGKDVRQHMVIPLKFRR